MPLPLFLIKNREKNILAHACCTMSRVWMRVRAIRRENKYEKRFLFLTFMSFKLKFCEYSQNLMNEVDANKVEIVE